MGIESKEKKNKSVKSRENSVKMVTKQLKELEEITEVEELIKNNIIKFKFENIDYKIRKPSPQEKREANKKRMEKYVELLKNDKYMLKEQWIEVYKEKGVNIREIDEKLIKLQNEHEKLLLKLAKTEGKEAIEDLKNDIINIREQQTEISFRKSELLQYSIETVLDEYVQTYLGYLVLEKKEGDKYIRAFKDYDTFMNQNEKLFARTMYFLSVLFTFGVVE